MNRAAVTTRARRRFGQHFLRDPRVIGRIVGALAPQPGDRIVEIGPGTGALTAALLERVARLYAIEIDRDLAARLQSRYPADRLIVQCADALACDFRALAAGGRLRIVGNLPYNISTPLLFRLLEHADVCSDMLFMLQKEVVDRLTAEPATREWGRLTVMLRWRCAVTRLFDVGAEAFTPRPRVDSSVVRLRPHEHPHPPVRDPRLMEEIVRRAFSARRKTLRNALRGIADASTIERAGLDPGARPDTLAVSGFAALADAVVQSREAADTGSPAGMRIGTMDNS